MKHDATTKKAYLDALARLRRGEGTHPRHVGKPIKPSAAAVAREAGLSRNPLYKNHRDVLEEIGRSAQVTVFYGAEPASALDLEREMKRLRREISRLKEDKVKLASENLSLLHRLQMVEKRLEGAIGKRVTI